MDQLGRTIRPACGQFVKASANKQDMEKRPADSDPDRNNTYMSSSPSMTLPLTLVVALPSPPSINPRLFLPSFSRPPSNTHLKDPHSIGPWPLGRLSRSFSTVAVFIRHCFISHWQACSQRKPNAAMYVALTWLQDKWELISYSLVEEMTGDEK